MIDPVSLAVGAALLVAGWLVGHLTGRRAERRRLDKPREPICGCGHQAGQPNRVTIGGGLTDHAFRLIPLLGAGRAGVFPWEQPTDD